MNAIVCAVVISTIFGAIVEGGIMRMPMDSEKLMMSPELNKEQKEFNNLMVEKLADWYKVGNEQIHKENTEENANYNELPQNAEDLSKANVSLYICIEAKMNNKLLLSLVFFGSVSIEGGVIRKQTFDPEILQKTINAMGRPMHRAKRNAGDLLVAEAKSFNEWMVSELGNLYPCEDVKLDEQKLDKLNAEVNVKYNALPQSAKESLKAYDSSVYPAIDEGHFPEMATKLWEHLKEQRRLKAASAVNA